MVLANQNGEIFSRILLQQKAKIQQHRVRMSPSWLRLETLIQ